MSEKNTVIRSLHDVGLAAWFGGALMGAVGLNGAAAEAQDPRERLKISSDGWGRWTPVSTAAVAAHLIGGAGLIGANKGRVATQPGARANTVIKTAVTAAAVGLTAWSGYLGRKVKQHEHEGAVGSTEPGAGASKELATAQQQLKIAQWGIPVATGVLLVMGANQGEQQRPVAQVANRLRRLKP